MAKVTIIQVIYNSSRFIEPVFSSIYAQTFQDFEVVAVISKSDDGSKELLATKFPKVKIIDPGYNIGFAKGHNLVFAQSSSEFFQLVNPDLILEADYLEKILKAFGDPKVGAATGKLLRYDFVNDKKTAIIDSTGVTISKAGRARDRGQHEVDNGQFDHQTSVKAVSGAGVMFRKQALESTKEGSQYFDEDFHSYFEDVDLTWRMSNLQWKNIYVPVAVAYHGRGAGSSVGGYSDVLGFIKHHRTLPKAVLRLNYKNHIFLYVKNSPYFYPQFFFREFAMLIYILLFEISTLKAVPETLELLSKMLKKRKYIKRIPLT